MKKLVSILMCLCMILSMFTFVSFTASAETYLGICGENLTWTFDISTGVLNITGSGDMYDFGYESLSAPWDSYKDSIETVVIENGVTSIGSRAFLSCESLTDITIPNGVRSIGKYTLYGCTSLNDITIPDSVTSIDDSAFANTGYYNNESNWQDGVLYIGNYLIDTKIVNMTGVYSIKEGTKVIASSAFYLCRFLTGVTIPCSITTISEHAFKDCMSLTNIIIPNGVTTIGDGAFSGCRALTYATIPNTVTTIGDSAFSGCRALTYVTIPNSVTSLGEYAFSNCKSLLSIKIPDSVTNIDAYAFSDCHSLMNITIPDSITSISEYMFSDCKSLKSIVIPESVTNICNSAFYDCASLESIKIGNKVTNIGEDVFYNCKSLASITIPDSVKIISDGAFFACSSLKNVKIGTGVTSIGAYAFYSCKSLTNITIPENVTSIGIGAFKNTTIYCKQGSYAQTYAIENNLKFHIHKYKWVTTKKATYFAKGTSSYKCSGCGERLKTKSIAKLVLKKPTFKLTGAKGKFTVKYTKVKDSTGFEIRYKLGNGKYKTVKVNTKKSMSKVIKNLKKGKYTVQVRAFRKVSGKKAYSSWASAKKVTVK